MSTVAKKQDVEAWVQALERYDQGDFKRSIETFVGAGETSKALFNIGIIHATLGEHDEAIFAYKASITKDPYFAIAHFQRGVSNFLLGQFEQALKDFTHALTFLRENLYINYEQLGLKFCLYRCEVLFNRGLCYKYIGRADKASRNFEYSAKEKMVAERHDVCDEAVGNCGEGYTVFSVPVGVIFRLTESRPPVATEPKSIAHSKAKSVDETKLPQRGLSTLSKARLLPKRSITTLNKNRNAEEPTSIANLKAGKLVQRSATTSGAKPRPPPLSELSKPAQRSLTTKRSNMELRKPEDNISTKKSPMRAPTAKKSIAEVMNSGGSYYNSSSSSDEGSNNKPQKSAGLPSRLLSTKRSGIDLRAQVAQIKKVLPPTPKRLQEKQLPTLPQQLAEAVEYTRKYKPEEVSIRRQAPQSPTLGTQPTIQSLRDGRDSGIGTEEEDCGEESDDDFLDYYGSEWSGRSRSSWATSVEEDPEAEAAAEKMDAERLAKRMNRRTMAIEVVTRIKLKMHHEDDLIAIMIPPEIDYSEFTRRIRDKLRLDRDGKIRFKDEDGQQVLLGDQEDLDQAVDICERAARISRNPVGKIEVWIS